MTMVMQTARMGSLVRVGCVTLTQAVRARGRRVLLLIGLVLMLSIGDLMTTLIFLQSTGMEEVNPIAAFVMEAGSPIYLIIFKMGSVLTSLSVILLLRHRWQGEVAAWTATLILCALTVHWYRYTHQVNEFDSTFTVAEAYADDDLMFWGK